MFAVYIHLCCLLQVGHHYTRRAITATLMWPDNFSELGPMSTYRAMRMTRPFMMPPSTDIPRLELALSIHCQWAQKCGWLNELLCGN